MYIYTYYIKGNHESEKIFLLKTFRRRSSTSLLRCKSFKIFCSDIHLNFFFGFVQVCYNKIFII